MKKREAEHHIRAMIHDWARSAKVEPGSAEMPSYSTFRRWTQDQGYDHYFRFRSTMGPEEDAELWFDQELKQTWRR